MKLLTGFLRSRRLFLLPIGLSLLSLILLIISPLIGVGHVKVEVENTLTEVVVLKEVGYVAALNWSISPFILFPLVGILTLVIIATAPNVLREMAKGNMFFDRARRKFISDPTPVLAQWNHLLAYGAIVWILLSLGGLFVSIDEWWRDSGEPLFDSSIQTKADLERVDEERERQEPREWDWSVAYFLKAGVDRTANAIFSLAVFLTQALALSNVALFLVVGVLFMVLIHP